MSRKFVPSRYSTGETPRSSRDFDQINSHKGWGHDQLQHFHEADHGRKIEISDIYRSIDALVEHQTYKIDQVLADARLLRHYTLLQRAAKQLLGTEFYDQYITSELRKRQIVTVAPGTVGQFLYGNIVDGDDQDPACSPVHIGALPNKEGISDCSNQVWYFDGNIFRQLTRESHPPKPKANIYVYDRFIGLSYEQKIMFRSYGVQSVTFYTMRYIGNDTIQTKTIQLTTEMPLEASDDITNWVIYRHPSNPYRPFRPKEIELEAEYDYGSWIWFLIAVIIIVIIAFIMYWLGKRQGQIDILMYRHQPINLLNSMGQ